jgi:glycosyltransferase involved in cell wall biosynthesis
MVGGAEVQQVTLARLFARAGYPVTVICMDHGQPDDIRIDDIRVLKTHKPHGGMPGLRFVHPRLTSMWRAMSRANADIYYQRCAGIHTAYAAAFCRRYGRRFIYSAASDKDFEPMHPMITRRRDNYMYHWGLRHAHAIVVQNAHQAEACKVSVPDIQPVIINNCYDAPAAATCDRAGYVLWVAVLHSRKQPDLFLELARRLPEFRFRMVGGGVDEDQALYRSVGRTASAIPNIEFTGFVPYRDIDAHFNGARLLVNTATYEGFPNTFLQAWARGIPTVSFVSPIPPETDGNPVQQVANMDEMVSRVRMLMTNDEEWMGAGQISRRWFAKNHSVEKSVAAYDSLFSRLTASGPPIR